MASSQVRFLVNGEIIHESSVDDPVKTPRKAQSLARKHKAPVHIEKWRVVGIANPNGEVIAYDMRVIAGG